MKTIEKHPKPNTLSKTKRLALASIAAASLVSACSSGFEDPGPGAHEQIDQMTEVNIKNGKIQVPRHDSNADLGVIARAETSLNYAEYLNDPERNIGLANSMQNLTEQLNNNADSFDVLLHESKTAGLYTAVYTPDEQGAYSFEVDGVKSSESDNTVTIEANIGDFKEPTAITPTGIRVRGYSKGNEAGDLSSAFIARPNGGSAVTGYESMQQYDIQDNLGHEAITVDSNAVSVAYDGRGGESPDTFLAQYTDKVVVDYMQAAVNLIGQ